MTAASSVTFVKANADHQAARAETAEKLVLVRLGAAFHVFFHPSRRLLLRGVAVTA